MASAFMAFLHHLLAFILMASLTYEFVGYHRNMSVNEARRIQRVDLVYGISAGSLIVVGLLRVFFFEKGPNFYLYNHIFWTKMALFAIIGLLSIYPTIRYIRWNPMLKENRTPEIPEAEFRNIRLLLWLEMAGIVLILFAAPLMARGIGV